jgi:3-isopropylmalate dehydrogenase
MVSSRLRIEWLVHNRGISQAFEGAHIAKDAISAALADPATRTRDIHGTGGTEDMTRCIVRAIEQSKARAA